jgi:hypothetical protein
MTDARLHDARMLIPGAFELNARPHRAAQPAHPPPVAAPVQREHSHGTSDPPYVVAAPARPTTNLGVAAAALGDIALCVALIFAVALIPALGIKGITAAAALVMHSFGSR